MGILYLVFVWTFVPSIIGVIEGILLLTMTDDQFNFKYGGVTQGKGWDVGSARPQWWTAKGGRAPVAIQQPQDQTVTGHGTVAWASVKLRAQPGGNVLAHVPQNTPVEIRGGDTKDYFVYVPSRQQEGWATAAAINVTDQVSQ